MSMTQRTRRSLQLFEQQCCHHQRLLLLLLQGAEVLLSLQQICPCEQLSLAVAQRLLLLHNCASLNRPGAVLWLLSMLCELKKGVAGLWVCC